MNDNEFGFGEKSENTENTGFDFQPEPQPLFSEDVPSMPEEAEGAPFIPEEQTNTYEDTAPLDFDEGFAPKAEETAYETEGYVEDGFFAPTPPANIPPVSGGAFNTQSAPPPFTSNYVPQNGGYTQPPQQRPPVNQQYYQPVTQPPKQQSGGGAGKKIAFGVIIACLVIALVVMVKGIFFSTPVQSQTTTTATNETTNGEVPQVTIATTQSATVTDLDSVNSVWVANKVRPSIVGVMTYIDGQLAGEGSGVLWGTDSTGTYTYVVTCAHVIDESGATYGILLLDGRRFEAEMVAMDARTDIGVIKVKASGLPVAELGDSSSLKIGEPIYAVGNPGGSEYFGSITDGIVSAIDRSISATYTMTCIQHNAAINPGNSGGALVNTSGQVVGINSSKIASTEYEGMGFAVPMSIVKPVVDSLIQYKYVPNRPKLGIEYADVSSYQLYSMVVSIKGLPKGSLVIAGISKDSTLANTEAQVGDLIIGVNGKDMDDSSVLLDLIDTGAVGDTLTLTLCRIEKRTYKTTTFDVTITLIEDKGSSVEEETTTEPITAGGQYNYGGSEDFESFFEDYFGFGF